LVLRSTISLVGGSSSTSPRSSEEKRQRNRGRRETAAPFITPFRRLTLPAMAHIKLKADTLDAEVARFAPEPLNAPVFVNSIPKSGTHLLKNILRMFVPIEQHYRAQFIQWGNLQEHLVAFDAACAELGRFDSPSIEAALRLVADARGVKAASLIHAVRVAVTGKAVSPGLFEVLSLLGRLRVHTRLEAIRHAESVGVI